MVPSINENGYSDQIWWMAEEYTYGLMAHAIKVFGKTVINKDTVVWYMQKESITKANGALIKQMVLANINMLMDAFMKADG